MKALKTFKYDVLIDREDICDRESEIDHLVKWARQNKKIVLLAPRRYGKTSLVKNVVAKDFKELQKKSLVIYIDLMDVRDLKSIANRIQHGLSKSLAKSFPVKSKLNQLATFFKQLSLNIEFDPISGSPSINISSKFKDEQKNIAALAESIKSIAKEYSLMLILDEFQDITFVPEAEALMRGLLQQLTKSTVFILGSKRHLLEKIFGDNRAPLFQYGDEIHLKPISWQSWLPYFQERLHPKKIQIKDKEMRYIVERLCDVPNSICELGAWLVDYYPNITLKKEVIDKALNHMVETRQSYAYRLQGFTASEKRTLCSIAQLGFVLEPNSSGFLKEVELPKSTVGKNVHKLLDRGVLEYELNRGYRLSDPIFSHYLATR